MDATPTYSEVHQDPNASAAAFVFTRNGVVWGPYADAATAQASKDLLMQKDPQGTI